MVSQLLKKVNFHYRFDVVCTVHHPTICIFYSGLSYVITELCVDTEQTKLISCIKRVASSLFTLPNVSW
jgi:hypothetical protein